MSKESLALWTLEGSSHPLNLLLHASQSPQTKKSNLQTSAAFVKFSLTPPSTSIITTVNLSNKKAASSVSQSLASASSASFEAYKRHMDDYEKLPGGLFESSKQLQIFKHNFKIAMHG
eukprot:6059071-Ditylum_brightwellii.AAC.1